MNSKTIRRTVLISLSAVVLLLVIVAITNREALARKLNSNRVRETMVQEQNQGESGHIGNDLSAFLRDEDFFEPEKKTSSVITYHGKKVSLMISSMSQDLRIMMVDPVGDLCTGAPFEVEIEGEGTYTDTDQDGVIYLEHLRSGTYYVTLHPMDGYAIENTKVMVDVKQKLDYVALSDIAYLILQEDQVDVEKEDTGEHNALEESDDTEVTGKEEFLHLGALGIDVSKYNKEIDWEKVADSGVEFAIIRCGYRGSSSGALIEDPMFKTNIKGAREAGLKVGVYFFSQAITEKEAVEEASMVEELCKYEQLDLPVYLDSESAGGQGRADHLSKKERTAVCAAFCRTIERAGHSAGVYASKNWFEQKLNTEELEIYSLWLAQYTGVPTYGGSYQIWQYTSRGTVDGVPTKVDMNIKYK